MHAILLCAGFGTRMYPLTRDRPKALLTVGGRTVLDYLMDQLVALSGLQTIQLVTNARFFNRFQAWEKSWARRLQTAGKRLRLYNDGANRPDERLGACRDLKLVFDRLAQAQGFLVAAGDNIFRFDLHPLWHEFRSGPHHRIVVLPESDRTRLRRSGVPIFAEGETDRVRAVAEKPSVPTSAWCCPPLYFLKPSAAPLLTTFLETAADTDAPGHFIDFLCRKETVWAFRLHADRLDIGDLDGYRAADRLLGSPSV